MRRCIRGLCTALALLGSALSAQAQDPAPDFVHAISAEDLVAMADRISPPRGKKSTHIWCDVNIDVRGRIEGGCLFNGHIGREMTRIVQRNMHKFKVRPASINGKPVEVWTQFSVFFTAGDKPKITVTPNSGALVKQFGVNYVAPQRVTRINFIACPMWGKISDNCKDQGLKFTINTQIDEHGRKLACHIIGENKSGADADAICADEMQFIPGHVNGQPTAMAHSEPWF